MKKILFVCIENAGRSQMAEAFANHLGKGKIEAHSAETMPSEEVNVVVVQVMMRKGIDISRNKPKPLDITMVKEADVIIVMGWGAKDFCPTPLIDKVIAWKLEDPKNKLIEKVRQIRDDVERRVRELINEFI